MIISSNVISYKTEGYFLNRMDKNEIKQNCTFLANILSFVIQNLTQYIHWQS